MIHIAITAAAFDAIAATLPLGSVAFEPQTKDKGERLIWLEPHIAVCPFHALAREVMWGEGATELSRCRATQRRSFSVLQSDDEDPRDEGDRRDEGDKRENGHDAHSGALRQQASLPCVGQAKATATSSSGSPAKPSVKARLIGRGC